MRTLQLRNGLVLQFWVGFDGEAVVVVIVVAAVFEVFVVVVVVVVVVFVAVVVAAVVAGISLVFLVALSVAVIFAGVLVFVVVSSIVVIVVLLFLVAAVFLLVIPPGDVPVRFAVFVGCILQGVGLKPLSVVLAAVFFPQPVGKCKPKEWNLVEEVESVERASEQQTGPFVLKVEAMIRHERILRSTFANPDPFSYPAILVVTAEHEKSQFGLKVGAFSTSLPKFSFVKLVMARFWRA